MKSVFYFRIILYTLICLLCSSCRQDEDQIEETKPTLDNEVRFNLPASTRSTDTQFSVGDEIGVYAVDRYSSENATLNNKDNYADNKRFRFNGTTFEACSEADKIIFPKDKVLDFYVYYPYTTENVEASFSFGAQPDQRDYARYTASDLLMAIYKEGKSNEVIHLEFIHKMALVEAILNIEDEKKVKGVTVLNRYYTGIANLADTSYLHKLDDHTRSDIRMLRHFDDDRSVVYRALMPCQPIANDELLFAFETESGTRSFQATSPVNLQPGTKNRFELNDRSFERHKVNILYNYGGIAFLNNQMTEGEFNDGDECIIHAQENESYYFDGWYEHGIKIFDKEHWGFTVTEDRVLEARFEPLDVHVRLDFLAMGTGQSGEGSLAYGSARLSMKYFKDDRWWNYIPESDVTIEASFRVLEQDRVSGADIGYRVFRNYVFKRYMFNPIDTLNLYYWQFPLISSNRMADLTDIYNMNLYWSDYGSPRKYIFHRNTVRFYRMNPSGDEETYELIKKLPNQNIEVF